MSGARASGAAAMAALAAIVLALCLRGVLPGMGVVVAMTLSFVAAWTGVIAATADGVSVRRQRMALGIVAAAVIILLVASGLFLSGLGKL